MDLIYSNTTSCGGKRRMAFYQDGVSEMCVLGKFPPQIEANVCTGWRQGICRDGETERGEMSLIFLCFVTWLLFSPFIIIFLGDFWFLILFLLARSWTFFFSFSCCFVGIRSFHWMVPDIYLSYWIYAFLSAVFGLFELRFSAVVLPTSHMINFPPITWVFTLMLRSISICFGRIGLTILLGMINWLFSDECRGGCHLFGNCWFQSCRLQPARVIDCVSAVVFLLFDSESPGRSAPVSVAVN